ncbi:TrmH family RNA methyltransferase [Clostridium oryzae]|uniref:Putative TrmH family tRNA/rRNA methyltransferase n=1 Tax=Clostridium oryzae TaxID=1450648 RepID=A0A1V4IGT4_9CLOT|nr:RNA methyltransferase [Clostridium oryzae]OPJ59060.1 putative TrmH family tRNA/rRNA methyltransferase [Clostridium oryzae]
MELIQSKDNAVLKSVKKLKQKKYRDECNCFFIEGFRFFQEAEKARVIIDKIFLSNEFINRNSEYAAMLEKEYRVYKVKDSLYRDICNTDKPQGISAVIKKSKTNLTAEKEKLYILADNIQDPGNMGTIIRTAHAVNAAGIIYTKGTVDPYNDKTLRSTMGSVFYVPLIEDNENLDFTCALRRGGYKLVVSSLKADYDFYDATYDNKLILAVGNEGNGISDLVEAMADMLIKIPMPGGAESLNVSIAAALMMYEVLRQRKNRS